MTPPPTAGASAGAGPGARAWVARHVLATFLALTFALSWGTGLLAVAVAPRFGIAVSLAGASPLAFLLVWSPTLAAVATVGLAYGVDGAVAFLRRVAEPRGGWSWYAGVLVGVPAVYLAAAVVAGAFGGPVPSVPAGWVGPFATVAAFRLFQGPVEELGWRGLALPLLQRRTGGLVAAVLLGIVWALWHVPATVVTAAEFARGGGEALPVTVARLFATLIATSVAVTVAFNGSGGSVPLAVLFHWLTNLAYPWEATGTVPLAQDVLTVVAAAVVALLGRRYVAREREHLSTDVIPAMARHDGSERPDGAAGG